MEAARSEQIPTAKDKATWAFVILKDDTSLVYVQSDGDATAHRLTARKRGWESDPTISSNGDLIAYAVADGVDAKSEVWISRMDGSHAYRASAAEDDAVMPAFAPDGRTLLYVKSRFNGHYSPIARPRRHEFDVVKVGVDPGASVVSGTPVELTEQRFFDLRSLSVSPDGERFLVSTSGYPIGSLIEEFDIATPLRLKRIFQPHVPSEPSTGASFGQAAYLPGGMEIVFTAATEGKNGMFDYNVYTMSDVTGGDVKILAQHAGVIDQLTVSADATIFVSGGEIKFLLNRQEHELRQF